MTSLETHNLSQPVLGTDAALASTLPLSAAFPTGERTFKRPVRPIRIVGRLLYNFPVAAWIAFDTVVIWMSILGGYSLFGVGEYMRHVDLWRANLIFAGAAAVSSVIVGLQERATLRSSGRIATRILLTTALATAIAYTIIYAVMYLQLSRRVVMVTAGSYLVIGAAVRLFAFDTIRRIKKRVLLVSTPQVHESFVKKLRESQITDHEITGYVGDVDACTTTGGHRNCLGSTSDIIGICRRQAIDEIVICNGMADRTDVVNSILPCLRMGARVTNEATFYEHAAGQIPVGDITPAWFLFSDLKSHSEEYAALKRVFDVAVSLAGLLIMLPIYPLVALAIKIEDGGPIFYTQDRVGKGGAIFRLRKFRSMRQDAETGGSVWAQPGDPRCTRVGRILRRTRIDEFPQFVNILMGEMSVVGPRPERPDIVMHLCSRIPFWAERNLVKPGLTGWAQISFRYSNSIEDARRKLQFDLYYIKHMNLELDLIILFRTIGTFLRGAC